MEALGFISYWGFTPSIDFFKGTPLHLSSSRADDVIAKDEDSRDINVLISECGDIRHLLRTLAENLPTKDGKPRTGKVNIYIHEKQKENLCRDILFLTLICEKHMSMRERQETFLDLYGNSLIRDKSANYLENIVKELIQLITEDERCQSAVKQIINFDTLKFKDRDEMEEIFS
jgi:dynein assembly factor 3